MSTPGASEPTSVKKPREGMKCLIIPLPKVVFFYPTALMAMVAAIGTADLDSDLVPKAVAFGYLNRQYIDSQKSEWKLKDDPTTEATPDDKAPGRYIPKFDNTMDEWEHVSEKIGASGHDSPNRVRPSYAYGWIFLIVFTLNIFIISYDFPGVKALMVAFGVMAVVFGGAYINIQYEFLPILGRWARIMTPYASSHFYFYIGLVLLLIILTSVIVNRFWNKWILEANRLVHKRGMLGDVREWPTLNLHVQKEINDIFEYFLMFAGTVVFHTGNPNERPIVLENVPFINRKEKQIRRILESWRVGDSD